MRLVNRYYAIAGLMISISLILGFFLINFGPHFSVISDSADYDQIAQVLSNGGRYSLIGGMIYPPLYPAFLSLIYTLFGHSYPAVYLIQFLLLGLMAFLVWLMAKTFFQLKGWRLVFLSALVLFWPYLILYSLLLNSEILFTFFLILTVYLILRVKQTNNLISAITGGITLGLATLARPVSLLLLPWLIITLIIIRWFWPSGIETIFLKRVAVMFGVMILVLVPWSLYTYSEFGRIIPVASNLPAVYEKANQTFGYLATSEGTPPSSWFWAKLQNVYLFWNPGGSGYQFDRLRQSFPIASIAIWLYRIGFLILLVLAVKVAWFKHRQPLVLLLILVILYFWSVHIVLFPFPRYTLPIIPLMLILATNA